MTLEKQFRLCTTVHVSRFLEMFDLIGYRVQDLHF